MKNIEEILKWVIHNGIMASSESSKEKVIAEATQAIKSLLEPLLCEKCKQKIREL